MTTKPTTDSSAAARFQELVRARGSYEHVFVRARGAHLLIETEDAEGVTELVARVSSLSGAQHGLSFRSHTGRWDPLPVQGTLEEIAESLVDMLGPYLDLENLA